MVLRLASSHGRELVQRTSWLWLWGGTAVILAACPAARRRAEVARVRGDIALPRTKPCRGRLTAAGRGTSRHSPTGRLHQPGSWTPDSSRTARNVRGSVATGDGGCATGRVARWRPCPSARSGRERRPARRARPPRSAPTGLLVAARGSRHDCPAGRGPDFAQFTIQRNQQPSDSGRDLRIDCACADLLDDGVDIVSGSDEHLVGRARHVFVELDLHSRLSGTSFSRARSAP